MKFRDTVSVFCKYLGGDIRIFGMIGLVTEKHYYIFNNFKSGFAPDNISPLDHGFKYSWRVVKGADNVIIEKYDAKADNLNKLELAEMRSTDDMPF